MFVMTFPTRDADGNVPNPIARGVNEDEIGLDLMQEAVGGLIQLALTVSNPAKNSEATRIDFYVNEEGRLIGLEQIFYLNMGAETDEDMWMNVAGPVFVCGSNDMGESVPLSMNELRYVVGLVGRPV